MREGLPKGWIETRLERCSHILDGYRNPISSDERNKRIAGKSENELYPYYGATGQVGLIDGYLIEGRYVLIGEDGAPYFDSKKNIAYIVDGKIWVNNHAHILDSLTDNDFLGHFLNQFDFTGYVTGTTRLKLTQGKLREIPIKLPPLNEQKRIVAKLDAIMPRIEAVKERLDKVPTILKRFRQSVLTAAVTGRLTEKWREEHPEVESAELLLEKIKNRKQIEIKEYPYVLPDEWLVCGFYDVAIVKSNLVNPENYQNYPHIAPDSIERETGKLLPYNSIKEDKVTSSKHLFKSGHIIYSKIRPYLSKVILVNFEGLCSADMYPIEVKIDSKYLLYNMLGGTFLNFASTAGTRSVLPKINQEELGQIPIPLPPLEEQKEIVRQVDKLFALADKVEARYQKAKNRVDKLSRSVLAKAFRGELVPQDPNDEPAEKLLERILEEKTKMDAELKGTKKKGAKKTVAKSGSGK